MDTRSPSPEPFLAHAEAWVVEVTANRAVVEQPAVEQLENHVGVRHASALHAAGYEAGRALVSAAVAEHVGTADFELTESTIAYTAVGMGPLTTVAIPAGAGWEKPIAELSDGAGVTLVSDVTTVDGAGKAVAELELSWTVRLPD